MLFKKSLFAAAAAALAALATSPEANAGPGSIGGLAPQGGDAAITRVDYYYRGYDDRYGYSPNIVEGLFGLPAAVLGTTVDVIGGAIGGPNYDGPPYGSPYYDGRYDDRTYDSGTYDGSPYYGGRYDDGAYEGGSYEGGPYYSGRYNDRAYDSSSYERHPYYGSSYYARADNGSYEGAYKGSGVAACERQFQSFDPASGTYITYGGEVVPCPYLDR